MVVSVLFVLAVVAMKCTKIKKEYILMMLLVIFGIFGVDSAQPIAAKILICVLAIICVFFVSKLDVNFFIRHSIRVYYVTMIMLVAVFIFPKYNGVHRYIMIGDSLRIEPGNLIIFSLLPICKLLNDKSRLSFRDIYVIFPFVVYEIALILLQPNLRVVFIMCSVLVVLFIKAKVDKRLNISWKWFVFFFLYMTVSAGVVFVAQPYRVARAISCFEYRPEFLELLHNMKLFGRVSTNFISAEFLRNMPIMSFAAKYGMISAVLYLIAHSIFSIRFFVMSSRIKNSFGRYVVFGTGTYFTVMQITHIMAELYKGVPESFQMPFGGTQTDIFVNVIMIGLCSVIYIQRDKIKVGRQLDIDYDMTDGVLSNLKRKYEARIKDVDLHGKEELSNIISKIDTELKTWNSGEKEQSVIPGSIVEYAKELGGTMERNLVFISYNQYDVKYAEYIAKCLEEYGLKTWHYKRDMKPTNYDNDFAEAIMEALEKTKIAVFILSKNSVVSNHVKNEVSLAFSYLDDGVVLMPVFIEDAELDRSLKYYLCRQNIEYAIPPDTKVKLKRFAKKVNNTFISVSND